MKQTALICLTAAILSLACHARAEIVIGQPLPEVEIRDKGELILEDEDDVSYTDWMTEELRGRVNVIQHLAARLSTKDINVPFTDRLIDRDHLPEHHHVTTVVNLDDALFGTSGIVASQLKGNKQKYPTSSIVADKTGVVAKRWDLTPKNSAIVILSPTGKVVYFKDGKMQPEDIETALAIIEKEVSSLPVSAGVVGQPSS